MFNTSINSKNCKKKKKKKRKKKEKFSTFQRDFNFDSQWLSYRFCISKQKQSLNYRQESSNVEILKEKKKVFWQHP